MIKFEKIILEDCFAYSYVEFDLASGIHSIQGVNGSSKTSVYLALAQGLFNKNPKGTKIEDVSNTITGQPYQITIFFAKDGDKYQVINSRKTGRITVKVNGKDISRKTIPQNLELIRGILDDTYETFVSMTYQASDSTLDLLEESGDTARKNFINKILKFEELDDKLAECKDKLKRLKAKRKDKQEQLENWRTSVIPYREAESLIDTQKLEENVGIFEGAKKAAEWYKNEMYEVKVDLASKLKAYSDYLKSVEQITKLEASIAVIEVPPKPKEDTDKELELLKEEVAKERAVLKDAEGKLRSLQEPELTCSRCGQSVSSEQAIALYKEDKARFEKQREESSFKINDLMIQAATLTEFANTWSYLAELGVKVKTLKSALIEAPVADKESYEKACANYEDASSGYVKASEELSEASAALSAALRHNDLASMVDKFNSEAEANNKTAENKIQEITKELSELDRRMDLLDNWTRILGPSGYRVHSMSRFLGVLNQTMDKYSAIISGGKIKCTFFITEEGKIEFSVIDPDKRVPFVNWSKGEQARVKLACLFSVIELLEIMGSASYNVLVLDEIFSALDDEGKEGLFEVLSFLRSNGKCIYTISHTPLVNPVVFDSTIQVVKEGGLARIT